MKRIKDSDNRLPVQHRIQKPGRILPNRPSGDPPDPPVQTWYIVTMEADGDLLATEENVADNIIQEEAP